MIIVQQIQRVFFYRGVRFEQYDLKDNLLRVDIIIYFLLLYYFFNLKNLVEDEYY